MKLSNSLSWILNSIQSVHSEHIFLHTLMYSITSLVQVLYKLSSLTIVYPNLVFNSPPLTLLVGIYSNCRLPSHHTFFCWFLSSPVFTKCILIAIYLMFFLSLPLLYIHTYDLISNIIRGGRFGTTYGSLFISSLFIII